MSPCHAGSSPWLLSTALHSLLFFCGIFPLSANGTGVRETFQCGWHSDTHLQNSSISLALKASPEPSLCLTTARRGLWCQVSTKEGCEMTFSPRRAILRTRAGHLREEPQVPKQVHPRPRGTGTTQSPSLQLFLNSNLQRFRIWLTGLRYLSFPTARFF
jgi:hypothetical protein